MAKKKPRRPAAGSDSDANDAAHHSTASDPHADRTRRPIIRSRPASSETVFAVREFMAAAASGGGDADLLMSSSGGYRYGWARRPCHPFHAFWSSCGSCPARAAAPAAA